MNLRNKFLKSLPIFSFLIIINSQFVHAKITEWDDFTEPLKVKFEMMYGANESIEVFIPESIIKNNEKLKLYLEITGYNFEYAEPYIKINDSSWKTYKIRDTKEVYIKTKHLSSGTNRITISTRRPLTQAFKVTEIRFELENVIGLENKSTDKLSNSEPINLSKNENILEKNELLDAKEKERIKRKEQEKKERIERELIAKKEQEAKEKIEKEILAKKKQEEKAKKLQRELAALTEALDFDTSLDISDRKNLQQGLKIIGYYNGKIDGEFGNHSRQSIKEYQMSLNENPTGYLKKENAVRIIKSGKNYFEKAELERIKREKEKIARQKELEILKAQLREEIKNELLEEMKVDTLNKNTNNISESNSKTKKNNQSNNRKNIENLSEQVTPISNIYTPFKTKSQVKFSVLIESFEDEYRSASNELKKSAVRTERKNAIKTFLNGKMSIKNWTGRLKYMGTNSEGKAYVNVVLDDSKIHLLTWDNSFSDMWHNTLIEQSTQLYRTIAEINEGDKVSVSGTFLSGEEDYISEQSVTERGSMTEPEFTFIFKSIDKI
jgi:peptidoglycan hydrolase-like protein with peptidoglycan-binding domain